MKTFIIFAMHLLCLQAHALKQSKFEDAITLDLYSVPYEEATHVMSRPTFFRALAKQSLLIKSARQDVNIAHEQYDLTYGNLTLPQTVLGFNYSYGQTGIALHEPQFGQSYTSGLTLTGDTGWGVQYGFQLPQITRTLSSSGGEKSETDSVSFGSTLTLNLLKGSLLFLGRAPRTQADLGYEIAKLSLRGNILSTLLQGETAFYDVLQKQISVRVQTLTLESAKALLSDVREMHKAGETDRISILKVELQVALAETELMTAQIAYDSSLQALKSILATPESQNVYPDPAMIKTIPEFKLASLNDSIQKAKQQRADYQSSVLNKQLTDLSVRSAFANTLPTLNLVGGYGFTGSDATFDQAFKNAKLLNNPLYSIGVVFSYSLFNDTDKTAYRVAKINSIKSDFTQQQTNNQLVKEVTTAIQSVEIGSKKLKMSELARSLAEKKLQAEFVKFKVGESNVRNITDYQTEVNSARTAEVSARIQLLQSISQYRAAIGEYPYDFTVEEIQ